MNNDETFFNVLRSTSKVTQRVPPESDIFQAASSGDQDWLRLSLKKAVPPLNTDKQGLTVLHIACLHGQLACIELLVASRLVDINASCPQGRRPVHMLLSTSSCPSFPACLKYLLEHGADISVTTDSGSTPLHLAASAGLLECTQMLVRAGADVYAQNSGGHTPLDLARVWCHRKIARFLRDSMWRADQKIEMGRRKQVQTLRQDLVDMARLNDHHEKMIRQTLIEEKVAEWANKKGLSLLRPFSSEVPSSQYHVQCLSPEREGPKLPRQAKDPRKGQPGGPREAWNISTNPAKPPPASVSRCQTVRVGSHPEKPPAEPDLRHSVTLSRTDSGQPQYTTKWDSSPRTAPNLPLDVLQRELFPQAYPSRIASPSHFQPQNVQDLPRLRSPQGQSTSPWTEVAMHLAEVLEPGHY